MPDVTNGSGFLCFEDRLVTVGAFVGCVLLKKKLAGRSRGREKQSKSERERERERCKERER